MAVTAYLIKIYKGRQQTMKKRVIEVADGKIVRDEIGGEYQNEIQ